MGHQAVPVGLRTLEAKQVLMLPAVLVVETLVETRSEEAWGAKQREGCQGGSLVGALLAAALEVLDSTKLEVLRSSMSQVVQEATPFLQVVQGNRPTYKAQPTAAPTDRNRQGFQIKSLHLELLRAISDQAISDQAISGR